MQTQTILYIVIAGIAALLLALFQYVYTSKPSRLKWLYAALRFITVFSMALLLINPKFEAVTYFEEQPTLVVAVDNSESISYLNQDENAQNIYNTITQNTTLNDRFNIQSFSFGNDFKTLDSLGFKAQQTNVSEVFKTYNELFENEVAPLLLITDGNQTLGNDYQYQAASVKQPIYPVILGDTAVYSDLRLQQVNVNRYAYLKNRFPVEVFVNYSGNSDVSTTLRIKSGNTVLFSKALRFSESKTSEIITATLNASSVGVKSYMVELSPLANEKNTVNNRKNFAIEVIDQTSNIAIVSEQLHPDLGALKKAIESNEQRKVSILKIEDYISNINDFQLVILFSPNNNFKSIFEKISEQKLNTFVIAGKTTDWAFLNAAQTLYKQQVTNQTEAYQPLLNSNFGNFIVDTITFDDFPPLVSEFGDITFSSTNQTVLYKTVNGNKLDMPLLSTIEADGQKHALLNGEGLWRWRAQSFLNTESFVDFDNFIGKLVQYLSSTKKRSRINVDYKSFYNGNDNISIVAQYFNKNYEFDANANLEIVLKNKEDNSVLTYPLLLNNFSYTVELNGINAGDYQFTVQSKDEPISQSGQFKVLEYNVEQQFLNADIDKLQSIAEETNGKAFFTDNAEDIIETLINDSRFKTIQKSKREITALIDWKYLLALIALALSLEWFIRKYNGLI